MSDILQQEHFGLFQSELYGDLTEWSRTADDERSPHWVEFKSGHAEFYIRGCTTEQLKSLRNSLTRYLKKVKS